MNFRAILGVLAAVVVATAYADIYSWKESSGSTAYGDHPPSGATQVRKLDKLSTPTPDQAGKDKSISEQELDFRKRRTADAETKTKLEQEKAHSEERKRACDQNRAHLRALESGQRIVRFNGNGEREVMDDQQRAAETTLVRNALESQCK